MAELQRYSYEEIHAATGPPPTATDISGSMIDHWNRCQRQYHYHHDLGLQPKELPYPIQVGRAGHAMWESYYRARIEGQDHVEATRTAEGDMAWRAIDLAQESPAFTAAVEFVRYYLAEHAEDDKRWRWLAVEREYRVPRGDWTFVATTDLEAQDRRDGEYVIWDHRLLWEPHTKKIVRRDQQLPRYVLAAQPTSGSFRAVRNMISTKPLAQIAKANHGRTKRVEIDYTQRRLEIVNAETERTAQEILAWRQLPIETRGLIAKRQVILGDKLGSCEQCPFQRLCDAEAWGEDASVIKELEYEPSDYYVSGV